MKALLQRTLDARVVVDGQTVGAIDRGLLVLVGIERDDDISQVARMADRLLAYRLFADDSGRMNRNVVQSGVVSCWSVSSLWRRTPAAACGPVFPAPPTRNGPNRCSMLWWRR